MKLKEQQLETLKVLSRENAAKVLLSIIEHNARSPTQLAVELNLQPVQVHRVLEELSQADLVRKNIENPTPLKSWVFYRPTPKGKEAIRLIT